MCGIFAFLNNNYNEKITYSSFMKGIGRGPDISKFHYNWKKNMKLTIGFHRLAINGFNDYSSNQPFYIDDCVLICNGEIYNWKKIYKMLNINPTTKSDCEVIIHLYRKYGIHYTLKMLDGVFAFMLFDERKGKLYVARDLYGVRPLFISRRMDKLEPVNYMFASEMKQLMLPHVEKVNQFLPGTVMLFDCDKKAFLLFLFMSFQHKRCLVL